MAVWYQVEKNEKNMKDFIESNWSFHDFRIESVTYIRSKDIVKVFLKYDTGKQDVRTVMKRVEEEK